jgi:ABC-2 type transport system permease protein
VSELTMSATPSVRANALVEAMTLARRSVRLSVRNTDGLIVALAFPIIMMVMFVYLFGGAISTVPHYVDYVLPGVLMVCTIFGAGLTATSVAHDLSTGIIDRFRSIDVRGETLIGAHVMASLVRNLASTAIVVGVAEAIGFRSHASPVRWLVAICITMLYILAMSWICAALGVLARSAEAANGLTFFISFLPYVSSAFVPIATMPRWLQVVARNQPITPVCDSVRNLLTGAHVGNELWLAIVWCVAIIVVSMVVAGVLFRRRIG